MNTRETTLRTTLRRALAGADIWSCVMEYGLGGSTGAPDLLVGVPILPVELKIGIIDQGRIYPARVRPAQIAWMDKFTSAGGRCRLVIGHYDFAWEAWSQPCCDAISLSVWRKGFALNSLKQIMVDDRLLVEPKDW